MTQHTIRLDNFETNLKEHSEKTRLLLEAKSADTSATLDKINKDGDAALERIRNTAQDLMANLKDRVHDCERLLNTRVTEEYVTGMGRNIQARLQEVFERKNHDTIQSIENKSQE